MQVPTGVNVSPVTAKLLENFRDRKQAKELAMDTADAIQKMVKLLTILAKNLREYAAEDDCCEAVHVINKAGMSMSPMADGISSLIAELVILHYAHHKHGDSAYWGRWLDDNIEKLAQDIVLAQEIRRESLAILQPEVNFQTAKSLEEALAAILGLRPR